MSDEKLEKAWEEFYNTPEGAELLYTGAATWGDLAEKLKESFFAGNDHGTQFERKRIVAWLREKTKNYPADVFPDDGVDDNTKTRWAGKVLRDMLPRLADQLEKQDE